MTDCCVHPRLQWRDRCGLSPHSALPTRVILSQFLRYTLIHVKRLQSEVQVKFKKSRENPGFQAGVQLYKIRGKEWSEL